MTTSTTILIIVVALVVLLLVAASVLVGRNKRNQHRHAKAEEIRGQAKEEALQVGQREALADETAAKARAAQAEADVKAAQASGLQQQAAVHRGEATASRDQLDEQWNRADKLDPAVKTAETPPAAEVPKSSN